MSKRRNHEAAFKARVALEGERTVSELATAYEVQIAEANTVHMTIKRSLQNTV